MKKSTSVVEAHSCSFIRLEMVSKMVEAIIFQISEKCATSFFSFFLIWFCTKFLFCNWFFFVHLLLKLKTKSLFATKTKHSFEGKGFIAFYQWTVPLVEYGKSVKSWQKWSWKDPFRLLEKSSKITSQMQSCGGTPRREATQNINSSVVTIFWYNDW